LKMLFKAGWANTCPMLGGWNWLALFYLEWFNFGLVS
jgi:hypothetical protein